MIGDDKMKTYHGITSQNNIKKIHACFNNNNYFHNHCYGILRSNLDCDPRIRVAIQIQFGIEYQCNK